MATARLVNMHPGPLNLPAPAPGKTYLVYEAEGTSAELDGAIRVVPAFLQALGPVNVSVEQAERLGRIAGAVGQAVAPGSPGGTRVTIGEAGTIIAVSVG